MNPFVLKIIFAFKLLCLILLLVMIGSIIIGYLKLSGGQQQLLWAYFIVYMGTFGLTGYYGFYYPCTQVSKKEGGSPNPVDCIFNLKPPTSAKFDRELFSDITFGNKYISDFILDYIGLTFLFILGLVVIMFTPFWRALGSPGKNAAYELLKLVKRVNEIDINSKHQLRK